MGLLVDGKWIHESHINQRADGVFVRPDSVFRHVIGEAEFLAEKDRYHLYVSHAYPWAHRAVIFHKLKSLENIISVSYMEVLVGQFGWALSDDSMNGKQFLHEIYTLAKPNYTGRVTVPVLWDKKTKTIVNNESSDIMRMFNVAFNGITGNNDDYYPPHLREEIDALNGFIYDTISNGVPKAGFATEQSAYESAVTALFDALDTLENRLSDQYFLLGDIVTECDWRLFVTLIRFDAVYLGHFKCNIRRIMDYPNLSRLIRNLYEMPGIADTVKIDHIKKNYYQSQTSINPTGIVPVGPDIEWLS